MTIFDDDSGAFPRAFVFKGLADFSGSQVVSNIPPIRSGIGKYKGINRLIADVAGQLVDTKHGRRFSMCAPVATDLSPAFPQRGC